MTLDSIHDAFSTYGYVLVFASLCFGIIGIPAPEESLLVIIGMSAASSELSLSSASFASIAGTIVGMGIAYTLGLTLGRPVVFKVGPWIGLSHARWERIATTYEEKSTRFLLFGYYMPGVRQMSPYVAGITRLPAVRFFLYSTVGAVVWVMPYILFGYWVASRWHIPPLYISSIGFILFGIFLLQLTYQWIQNKRKRRTLR